MTRKTLLRWLLGTLCLLAAASPAAATSLPPGLLRVHLIPEVSSANVWRFEVVNNSVHTLDIVRLTAVFSVGDHRLWGEPAVLTSSVLEPGQAAWVSLDVRRIPKRSPVRIDWELTWNPYSVPVLHRFLRTEWAASLVVRPGPAAAGPAATRAPEITRFLPAYPD